MGYGWYQDNIAKPAAAQAALNKPVAKIGNQTITKGTYNKFLKAEKAELTNANNSVLGEIQTLQTEPQTGDVPSQIKELTTESTQISQEWSSIPSETLSLLMDAAIIDQKASTKHITISQAAIDKYIRNFTWESQSFNGPKSYAAAAKVVGLSVPDFTALNTLQYKVQTMTSKLQAQIPKKVEQAWVRHILISVTQFSQKKPIKPVRTKGEADSAWTQAKATYVTALAAYNTALAKHNVALKQAKAKAISIQHQLQNGEAGKCWPRSIQVTPGVRRSADNMVGNLQPRAPRVWASQLNFSRHSKRMSIRLR